MTNGQTQSVKNSKNTKDKPKNVRLTKVDLAFFFFLVKLTRGEWQRNVKEECSASTVRNLLFAHKYGKKGGVAMITLKDIRGIFNHLRKILAMLDKIYHAMGLDKEDK